MLAKSCICPTLAIVLLFAAVAGILKLATWNANRAAFRYAELRADAQAEEGGQGGLRAYGEHVADIRLQLQRYRMLHNADAVLTDSALCSRQFVLVNYPTVGKIGDTMFEFLNGFALALFLNRTIVTTASMQDVNKLPWKSKWMVDIKDLKNAWRKGGCSQTGALAATMLAEAEAAGVAACCGGGGPAVMLGQCARGHHFYRLLGDPAGGLSGPAAESVGRIFGIDEYSAYGLLLRSALVASPSRPAVVSALAKIENYHTSKDMVMIGIHVRHISSDPVRVKKEVDAAYKSLEKVVPLHTDSNKLPCAILMSSNREELYMLADSGAVAGKLLGCSITRVQKLNDTVETPQPVGDGGEPAPPLLTSSEMDDLNLLSLSEVFIGSTPKGARSEFSLIVADLVASGQNQGSKNIYWISDVVGEADWNEKSPRLHTTAAPGVRNASAASATLSLCDDKQYCSLSSEATRKWLCPRLQGFATKMLKQQLENKTKNKKKAPPLNLTSPNNPIPNPNNPIPNNLNLIPIPNPNPSLKRVPDAIVIGGKPRPEGQPPAAYNPKFDFRDKKQRGPPASKKE
jgi:hypothetical protein